jgi:hypothetical protein
MKFTDKLYKTFNLINENNLFELNNKAIIRESDIIHCRNGTIKTGEELCLIGCKVDWIKSHYDVLKAMREKNQHLL